MMGELLTYTRTAALDAIADRIRQRMKTATADVIAIGKDLIAAKAQLEHGAWLPWLDAEFGWAERTARNYMRAADFAGTKSATVAVLPPSTVYLLAAPSTPEKIKTDVIAEIETGKPVDHRKVEERIRKARSAERKAKMRSAKTAAQSAVKKTVATLRREPTAEEKESQGAQKNLAERLVNLIRAWSREFGSLAVQEIAEDALVDVLDRVRHGDVELGE